MPRLSIWLPLNSNVMDGESAMNWRVTSTIEPTIKRRDAFFLFCISIAFGAFPFIVSTPLFVRISAAFFLSLSPLFLFVIVFPNRSLRGIRMLSDGFEYCFQFTATRVIHFEEISMIEAVGIGSSDNDEKDLLLWIYTKHQRVSVFEYDLYRTGLLEKLEKLPGFNRSAISNALSFQPRWRDCLKKKRFVVFSR